MSYSLKFKSLVLALCISTALCFGQQQRPSFCRLADNVNDSVFASADTLLIDCSTPDPAKFKKTSALFTSLQCIIITGESNPTVWAELLSEIKLIRPALKEVVFDKNNLRSLPAGYENLHSVENLSFINNEDINIAAFTSQLATLPNLRNVNCDIYSFDDLPEDLKNLTNLERFSLSNKEEAEDEEALLASLDDSTVTYDFSVEKENGKTMALKYSSPHTLTKEEYDELARRFRNKATDVTTVSTVNNFSPVYKYIKPPIPGLNVEVSNYSINPGIDNVLVYPSGTRIFIPANSFADKNNRTVTESVIVNYREFRDQVDILVSGIPMVYDSANSLNNFESAGMFELNAGSGNEAIQLAPGKQIKMNFASTSIDSSYNFYSFNDSTGNWDYENKPKTVTVADEIVLPKQTPAIDFFLRNFRNASRTYDKTSFNARFEDLSYSYIYKTDSVNFPKGKHFFYEIDKRRNFKPTATLVKITRIRKTKEGDVLFKIRFVDEAHPELKEFNNYYFELEDELTFAELKQKFPYKRAFSDVRITSSGGNLQIKLKDNKGFTVLNARLVTIADKNKIKEVAGTKQIVKKYTKKLSNREHAHAKKIKKKDYDSQDMITLSNPEDINKEAFEDSRGYMTANEKKMSYEEWMTYYNQVMAAQKELINKSGATANNLIQSLSLDGMGIYNCDQILRLQEPVEIFASYKNQDSETLSPSATFIIDKKSNSVLQYNGYGGFDAHKIAFSNSANAVNVMIAVNNNGTISIYKPEDFKGKLFKNKSKFDFTVTEINSKLNSVGDLRTIVGL